MYPNNVYFTYIFRIDFFLTERALTAMRNWILAQVGSN